MVLPRENRVTPVRTVEDGHETGGCGLCCGQCCALVRKNALSKRRSKIQLLIELVLPAIIISLIGTIKSSLDVETIEGEVPELDTPIPTYDLLQGYISHPNVLCFDNNMFLRCDCHSEEIDGTGWSYITSEAVDETGLAMFGTLHSEEALVDMCDAALELVSGDLFSSSPANECTVVQFLWRICSFVPGAPIEYYEAFSSLDEACGEGTSEVDLSAGDYLEVISKFSSLLDDMGRVDFIIPAEDIGSVCQTLTYAVMDSDDLDGSSQADDFLAYVEETFPETFEHWTKYGTESEFEDVIKASGYSREAPSANVIGFSAGLVFSSGSPNWEYTIRANLTKAGTETGSYYMLSVPLTSKVTENNCKNPEDCPDFGEGYEVHPWASTYHQSPALVLQQLVDSWIMTQEGVDASAAPTVRITEFPWSSYEETGFWEAIGTTFAILVVVSVLYPISNVISLLAREKELRIKEGLRMMGLSPAAHTWSWIFHFVCIFFCISFLIMISSGSLFEFSNPVLIFLYFFLFFMATTAFCFCIAAFFSRAKTASTLGTMLFFVALFPFFAVESDGQTPSSRRAACLLPPTCLALGTIAFSEYEDSGEGVTPDTAGVSEDGFTFNDVLGMLILDIIIYSALAWYLGNVIPSEWGTSYKPWFIFTQSYWCPGSASVGSMEENHNLLKSFESDNRDTVEAVEDELKSQIASKQCVAIRGLTKEYQNATGGSKVAVDGLDLTMYSGQITALLGHNGAGKTTTIGMLTGMVPVTSGVAFVGGRNVHVDMANIRKNLGVCPQHDILYPMLTVREHLRMYAVIKGVPRSRLSEVIKSTLMDVGLTEKENELTKTLSGGQKRKLSVGIAFIGGSRVVFLDEPTSGMDPHSRRFTWELIRKNREGRVIVLTTHFMDEADLLGDRIAIMADGALRCCGSSLFLKNHYGVGYNLTIVRSIGDGEAHEEKTDMHEHASTEEKQKESIKTIKRLVASYVPSASLLSNVGAEISFQLPNDASPSFKAMLTEIDARKDELGLGSYGMSVTTLEEVFLRVANGTADVTDRKTIANISLRRQSSLSQSMKEAATAKVGANIVKKGRDHDFDRNKNLFTSHMRGLLVKRLLTFRRDKKMWAFVVIVPVLFVILGIIILESVIAVSEPSLFLTPQDYNDGDGAPLPYVDGCTITNGTCDASMLMTLTKVDELKAVELNLTGVEADGAVRELNDILLDEQTDGDYTYGAVSFRQVDFESQVFDYTVHSNYSALHGVPVYMNRINTAILRLLTGDDSLSISVNMHPMPQTEFEEQIDTGIDSFTVSLFIVIAFAFIPTAWISYVVREKETKCKHQQVVSGVSLNAYWASSYVWDVLSYVIPAGFTLVVLAAADVDALITGEAATATILLFVLHGLSMPSYTYLMSFFFKSYSTAQNTFLFHNFIMGLIVPIAVTVMGFFEGSVNDASTVMTFLFNFCPQFALGLGLFNMGFMTIFGLIDDETYTPLHLRITGRNLIYMGTLTVVYGILLLLVERGLAGGSWLSRMFDNLTVARSVSKLTPKQLGDLDEIDEDVAREAERVKSNWRSSDVVTMTDLRKVYPTSTGAKVAVKSTSLGIPTGECFGLLGINGAGKSSTLAILSGELPATTGSAVLAGFDVRKNPEQIHRLVGYCPQFDALFETLTGREHLRLYAIIKGIPADKIEAAVEEKIEEMGLKQYCEKPAGGYSGGNKRKLSVAIAMIGDPQIVFLDEPSTGMDPVARRFMWNVIMRIVTENKECAMILTTHSMEECEALCQRIGIMVGGRMRCLGSAQHLKTRFGKGFQFEARVPATNQQETDEMMSTISEAINGQENITNGNILIAAVAAAGAPDLTAEITAEGRGAGIRHLFEAQGYIAAREFASWVCVEKKCSKVMAFVEQSFNGAILREKQNNKMRYEFPQQSQQSLSDMFGFIEDNRYALSITEYSLSQTSLEQIFNGFAAQQEEEKGLLPT